MLDYLINLNHNIFLKINHTARFFNNNELLYFISEIFNYKNFHYHFFVILFYLVYKFLTLRKDIQKLHDWFDSAFKYLSVLAFSLIAGKYIIFILKNYFAYPRPYCNDLGEIHIIPELIKHSSCYASFPSGHSAFCVILVLSVWPLMNKFLKIISIFIITLLAYSRIAAGAHYPADILKSIIIGLILTISVRNIINAVWPTLWNLFITILKKCRS